MEDIEVKWSIQDLESEMQSCGIEPTEDNISQVMCNRLEKTMEEEMTSTGWNAMREVILDTFNARGEE